jgi:DNA-binding response OmpR family regulator
VIESGESVELGSWQLWPHSSIHDGSVLRLTGAEAAVLYALARAPRRVVSPVALGARFSQSENSANSVRVIVARLRRKLGADCPIETIHGFGYRWREQPHQPKKSRKAANR